jgi:hypothetical protein
MKKDYMCKITFLILVVYINIMNIIIGTIENYNYGKYNEKT